MQQSTPPQTTQYAIRNTQPALALALLFLLAIAGLAFAETDAPTLKLTVDPGMGEGGVEGAVVRPGDVVTATVALTYTGGSGPINTTVLVNLPKGLELAGRPTISESPAQSVNPLAAQRRDRTVGWQGSLRNGGTLILRLPMRVGNCWGGFRTLTVNAGALRPGGGNEQASGSLRVHCPLATLDDIHVTQRVLWVNTPAWSPYDPGLIPGQGLTLGTTFRNDAPVPVILGVSRPRVLSQVLSVGVAQEDASNQRMTLLHLAPGESRRVDQSLKPGRAINPASLLDGEVSLTVGVIYCLLTDDERTCATTGAGAGRAATTPGICDDSGAAQPRIPCPDPGQIPDPSGQVTVTIPLRPNDLGDAPDSDNHAGQPMIAYPGVTAHFPTVFARLPGDPPGPLHRFPRPVHLGPRVSLEAEADSGPDADPTNNILPGQDAADRDRYDDGLLLSSVKLTHCQPARMQLRVGLQSAAAKQILLNRGIQTLYLNVWIDGNRDGDWNDSAACSPQPNDLALEHIVIDQPVPVSQLGPGLNPVNITAGGKALWSSNSTAKPAWLRVTLSEAKSPKLTGRAYGDGRGPATGYRLGETEDYLWRPAGSPDVEIAQSGAWVDRPLFSGAKPATDRYAQFRITYQNRGNSGARDVTIVQNITGFGKAELVEVHAPGLPANAIQTGDGTLSVYVQEIPSGAQGSILVSWRPQAGVRSGDAPAAYSATVNATSTGDVDSSNNSASTDVAETSFLQMGLRTAKSPLLLQSALTCRNAVDVVGMASPGAVIHLSLDGTPLAGTVTAGADGRWQRSLSGLADGLHVIRGWTDHLESDPGMTLLVRVDSSLPIDPASFTITDNAGRSFAVNSPVWDDTDIVHLVGSGPFAVGVNSCTALTSLRLGFIGETEKNIALSDPDKDGRFTGVLNLTSRSIAVPAKLSLIAGRADGETVFDLSAQAETLGKVTNATTGQPIAGATVSLLVEEAAPSASGTTFGAQMLDATFGQANPQTTGADGSFYFAPPSGVYRLLVSAPGYQPYRTAAVEVNDGGVGPTIRLMAALNDEPDVTVIISAGGFEPDLLTIPPGTVVEWVNGELAEHTTTGEQWDSGVLWPGESFRLRLSGAGSFDYGDRENPLNDGRVTVDPAAPPPGTQFIFLPAIHR